MVMVEEIMFKSLRVLLFGVLWLSGLGCSITTPEIRGVVLDEETKQPVEGAWISATIAVKTKTVGGDVGQIISLDLPHTRTGKNGNFLIPKRKLKKMPFPIGFGTRPEDVIIVASTADDKNGSIRFEAERLQDFLRSNMLEVTISIVPLKWSEEEYFSHLQSLYNYCITGRFGFEVPPVEGGCDEWELDYAIAKHERYLEKYRDSVEKNINTVIFDQLAYLYEKKGDLKKAIEALKRSLDLIEGSGLSKFEVWQRNRKAIQSKIKGLQKKLEEVQK